MAQRIHHYQSQFFTSFVTGLLVFSHEKGITNRALNIWEVDEYEIK